MFYIQREPFGGQVLGEGEEAACYELLDEQLAPPDSLA
jgi:hypothetical protein